VLSAVTFRPEAGDGRAVPANTSAKVVLVPPSEPEPTTVTPELPTLLRARRAVCTAVALAFQAMVPVVCVPPPLTTVRVKVPAVPATVVPSTNVPGFQLWIVVDEAGVPANVAPMATF
jgi:hypothetical protein